MNGDDWLKRIGVGGNVNNTDPDSRWCRFHCGQEKRAKGEECRECYVREYNIGKKGSAKEPYSIHTEDTFNLMDRQAYRNWMNRD